MKKILYNQNINEMPCSRLEYPNPGNPYTFASVLPAADYNEDRFYLVRYSDFAWLVISTVDSIPLKLKKPCQKAGFAFTLWLKSFL